GAELGGPFAAALAFDLQAGDLLLPVVDLATAGAAALLLELGEVGSGLAHVLGQAALLGAEPLVLELEALGLLAEQPHQVLGGVDVDVGAAVDQVPAASAHLGPALVVLPQSAQQLTLLAGGDQCRVALGAVVAVCQGLVGQREGAGEVVRVGAAEGGGVAQLLGGPG